MVETALATLVMWTVLSALSAGCGAASGVAGAALAALWRPARHRSSNRRRSGAEPVRARHPKGVPGHAGAPTIPTGVVLVSRVLLRCSHTWNGGWPLRVGHLSRVSRPAFACCIRHCHMFRVPFFVMCHVIFLAVCVTVLCFPVPSLAAFVVCHAFPVPSHSWFVMRFMSLCCACVRRRPWPPSPAPPLSLSPTPTV